MKSPLGMIKMSVLLMLAGTVLSSGPASALDIYVAADGHDSWSGRFAGPDAMVKDGPFSTLERARDEIRKLKREKGLRERLDGSGYPLGLSGNAIRIEARILAVADVVEAMASHRPYRAALGIEAALAEIVEKRDTWFDTDVVAACVRLFREKGFTFEA